MSDENALTCSFCRGDDRTRTDDPLLAKQVLYQLSYVPWSEAILRALARTPSSRCS